MALSNKTYGELHALVQALAGVDNFTTAEQTKLLASANRRLYQAYNATPSWPRYMVQQARPAVDGVIAREYAGTAVVSSSATRSGVTVTIVCTTAVDFAVGMSVLVADLGYTTQNPNGTVQVTGVSTTTIDNDTFTYDLDDGTDTETYTGTAAVTPVALSDIADYFRVHSGNPSISTAARDVEWWEDSDGAHIVGTHDALAGYYVTFKKEWPGPYVSSATDIPLEHFYYAAHATYADFLRADDRIEAAMAEEAAANEYLLSELLKPSQLRNNNRLYSRIITHSTSQAR
jgi:hypothetical protein